MQQLDLMMRQSEGKEAVVGDEVSNFLNRGIWLPATITR